MFILSKWQATTRRTKGILSTENEGNWNKIKRLQGECGDDSLPSSRIHYPEREAVFQVICTLYCKCVNFTLKLRIASSEWISLQSHQKKTYGMCFVFSWLKTRAHYALRMPFPNYYLQCSARWTNYFWSVNYSSEICHFAQNTLFLIIVFLFWFSFARLRVIRFLHHANLLNIHNCSLADYLSLSVSVCWHL